jgi:hypothetical protein
MFHGTTAARIIYGETILKTLQPSEAGRRLLAQIIEDALTSLEMVL